MRPGAAGDADRRVSREASGSVVPTRRPAAPTFLLAVLAIGLWALTTALAALPASAQSPPSTQAPEQQALSVTFAPDSVELAPGRSRQVVLTLTTTKPVSNIALTFVQDEGVEAVADAVPDVLPSGVTRAVTVRLSVERGTPIPSVLHAVVAHTAGGPSTTSTTSLSLVAPAVAPARTAPLSVTAASSRSELLQYQEASVFFTVTNVSDRPQQLGEALVSYPSYLTISSGDGDERTTGENGRLVLADLGLLDPGAGTVVQLQLEADQPLQPGGSLVVLSVPSTDGVDGSRATAVASQQLTLAVVGESGILQLLGVPALLFVPGLIFVLVLFTLWRYVYPRTTVAEASGFGVDAKVLLWVFALLPSLALPFAYPHITGALGQERNYLRVYGLDDILYAWLIAAGAAVLVWLLAVLVRTSRQWWRERRLPKAGQDALELLATYARAGLKLPDVTADCQGQSVLLLRPVGADSVLVTPPIRYETANLTPEQSERLNELHGRPKELRRELERLALPVAYHPDRPLPRPTVVPASELGARVEGGQLVGPRT